MNDHLSPRALDALAAAEPARDAAMHVESCARCRELLAARHDDRDRLLARTPPATFVALVATRRRIEQRRRRVAWASGAAGAVVACAATWAVLVRPEAAVRADSGAGTGDGVRLKGVGVEVYRRRGELVTPLGADDRLRAGDGLRVVVTLPAAAPVSVWFVDRAGHVDRYPGATELALAAGASELPGAVVVDAPCLDLRLVVSTGGDELAKELRCE